MKKFFAGWAFLFILPGLLGFSIFYLWPFFISLGYSFMDSSINGNFVGLKNYIELLNNKPYIKGFTNTAKFIGICVPLNMILSLALAMLINKEAKHKDIFTLIFMIPLVIPSGATVFFWKAVFENLGWLQTSNARFVIAGIFLWKNMGYNMILFLAGLNNIPKEYYEAASVDGAGGARRFLNVTLPGLLPTMVLTLIMSVINSFKIFKEAYLIMGSYPHDSVYMLQHFMNNMFFSLNYQKLTAAMTILVVIITAFTSGLFKLERKVGNEA